MLAATVGNIFINGDLSRWSRLEQMDEAVECAVWRQTFAADRWKVRYAAPSGAPVVQARSQDIPPGSAASGSLELRGAAGVEQAVLVGQRIEAAEAARYRRQLVLSAWIRVIGSAPSEAEVATVLSTAREPDAFGGAANDGCKLESRETLCVPTGRWTHLEMAIDGRKLGSHGLSIEIEFPPALLSRPDAIVRLAHLRLDDLAGAGGIERAAAMEEVLARRFFQRHDSSRMNSLGRALVVNAHELHFQFSFPEMRAFPACTLPHDERVLRVFDLEGIPQDGFRYDVTYRSRGSAIVRAIRENHGLSDAFLSFVGTGGAILLDSEL